MGLVKDIWRDESNRRKHFLGGALCGLAGTVLFAAGVGTGMEYKDSVKGGSWDWKDWWATLLGGVTGQLVQAAVVWIVTS